MDKLLPCPFCGSEDVIYHDECDEEACGVTNIALCRGCGARGGVECIGQGWVGAAKMWNRRIHDADRVAEWAKADVEGRLVVLPCKVGDPIYALDRHARKCYGDLGYLCIFPIERCDHNKGGRCYQNYRPTIMNKTFELMDFDFSLKRLAHERYMKYTEAEAAIAAEGGRDERVD